MMEYRGYIAKVEYDDSVGMRPIPDSYVRGC
jgi:hypothetical protein